MNRCLPALTLLAIGLFLLSFWIVRDFTCDDAGISFCYARSLAEGRGLVLTPGSERAEGYSNLLWVVLLALGVGNGLDPVVVSKSLAVAASVTTLLMLAWLPAKLGGRAPRPLDLLPCLLLAVSAPQVFWSAGGLETSLFTAFLVAALASFATELERKNPFPASAVLLFAASLTRPEGPLYVVLLLPVVVACRPRRFAASLEWLAAFSVPYATYTLWRGVYFGSWMPTVFHAKMPGAAPAGLLPGSSGWTYLAQFSSLYWPWYLAALTAWGMWRLARQPLARWVPASVAASLLFILLCGGDWMQHFRMLAPAVPFLLIGLLEGLRGFREFVFSPDPVAPGHNAPTVAAALAVVIAVGRIGIPQAVDLAETRGKYRVTFDSRVARGEVYRGLAAQAGLAGGVLAEPDAGGTAWASGLDFLDLTGLTDRTLCRYRGVPAVRDEYIFEQRRPTFLRLHGVWGRVTGLAGHPELTRAYVPLPALPGNQPEDRDWVRRDLFVAGAAERPELPLQCSFGGEVRLAGVSRVSRLFAPGGRLELLLYWKALSPSPGPHRVRIAVAGANQFEQEHLLALGWLNAEGFRPGETIRERRTIELPSDLPEGHYELTVAVDNAAGRPLEREGKFPSRWGFRVARLESRRHALEMADALLSADSRPPDSRSALWHRMRQLELSGSMTESELDRTRRLTTIQVLRRGAQEATSSSRPLEQRIPEAAACLLQARLWGNDGRALERQLVGLLLATSRRLSSEGATLHALRWAALAARVAPSDPDLLAARDALWEPFVRQ